MSKTAVFVIMMVLGNIASFGQAMKKVAYQVHKRPGSDWYSVVIQPINPAKDDYKAYCRYIVRQEMAAHFSANTTIMIYDNERAYTQYEESAAGVPGKGNVAKYDAFVHPHVVGEYSYDPAQEDYGMLLLYEFVKKYHSHEDFKPR